ncbi:MAG: ferrochelatase [bacterium]
MKNKKAIVLLQFGGPDSLDAVKPFLFNLFKDPDIVQFPGGMLTQRLFAFAISTLRFKKLQQKYSEIGGRSPITETTFKQRDALQQAMDLHYGKDEVLVTVAMRYWKPETSVTINELIKKGITDILLLPLYAQYSVTNAGSAFNEWDRQVAKLNATFNDRRVKHYHKNPTYIQSFQERIQQALEKFNSNENIYILFSAHGTPLDIVKKGDPYSEQIRETMELVVEPFRAQYKYGLSFQSKVGPKKWLEPDTEETIEHLIKEGKKKLLIVPISFVSDHIETLHELNIEAREEAEEAGVEEFIVSEGLNISPTFIRALTEISVSELEHLI